MRRASTSIWACTAILSCAVALTTATPATAARPDGLVVFGDSLVDAGNAYIATGGLTAQPGYGYFAGRFSNGPVWTDLVEQKLTGHYTVPAILGGSNFAVGGAQAAADRSLLGFTVPGLGSQLGLFVKSKMPVDPKALYVLNFGNNDVSALLAGEAAAADPAAALAFKVAYTNAFVGNYLNAVNALALGGARDFLIGGVPNPDIQAGVDLEGALKAGLATLPLVPGETVTQIDYFGFFNHLRRDPADLGLPADLDVKLADACVDISKPPSNPNPDCTHYLSFDGIHPTAPVHAALAAYVDHLIGVGAVPEPETWAQLIAGFALSGAALRRSRRPMRNLIAKTWLTT